MFGIMISTQLNLINYSLANLHLGDLIVIGRQSVCSNMLLTAKL